MFRAPSLLLALGLLGSALSLAAPVPPRLKLAPQPPERLTVAPILNLTGHTNWGHIEQHGRHFTITGDHTWTATGEVMRDGRVQVTWYHVDGAICPSVYSLSGDGKISGQWGYAGECEILGNGNIVGDTRGDEIRPVAPPKAEGPEF